MLRRLPSVGGPGFVQSLLSPALELGRSTEVIVTDESIRQLVPADPAPYAEVVRRALEAGSRSD